MTCERCGAPTPRARLCRDCGRDELVADDAGTCAEDGCHEPTAFCSPFCETHD